MNIKEKYICVEYKCVCVCAFSLCDEIIETTINSKHTACFYDVINLACFTAVGALHSTSIHTFGKEILNKSLDSALTIEFC